LKDGEGGTFGAFIELKLKFVSMLRFKAAA